MNYQLIGDAMQTLLVNLEPGESLRAEAGAMLFCNDAVRYDPRTAAAAGGVAQATGPATLAANPVGGQSVAYTSFECFSPGGSVAFAAPFPGKIHALELQGEGWLCQRESLLCATAGVTIETAVARKFGNGVYGSEGFLLWKLAGQGTVWVHLGGNLVESEIAPGRQLRVDAGCLGCCQQSVNVELQFEGGYRNNWFGGEGSLVATLSGSGTALIQTLPLSRLAARVAAVAGRSSDPAPSGAFGQVGNLFRD